MRLGAERKNIKLHSSQSNFTAEPIHPVGGSRKAPVIPTLKLAVRNPIKQLSIISFRDFWYKVRTRPLKGTGSAHSSFKAKTRNSSLHIST